MSDAQREWYSRVAMRIRGWLVVLGVLIALAIAGIGASIYTYNQSYDYFANELTILPEIIAQPRPVSIATPKPSEGVLLPKPWNGKERVNVLVLGIDQRTVDREKAFRTDTMIVLTLDPVTLQAGMLSIPRDIWVPIPGYDNNRINTANFIGDASDYPGGGPALARKTVENFLGIPIHFVVRLNFTAFENFIDSIGGIEVDVPQDIYDPEYPTEDYGIEVFSISRGLQTLDGPTALKYARTRHSKNGDFDRARRQQQVILAVREKLMNPQVLASLIASAPELLVELNNSIKTDMTLEQMQELAVLGQKVDRNSIKSEVLDQRFTEFATTPEGYEVVIPSRVRIGELRDQFFATAANSAAELRASSEAATPQPNSASAPVSAP